MRTDVTFGGRFLRTNIGNCRQFHGKQSNPQREKKTNPGAQGLVNSISSNVFHHFPGEKFPSATKWWRSSNICGIFIPRSLGKIFSHFDGLHIFQVGWLKKTTNSSDFGDVCFFYQKKSRHNNDKMLLL